MGDTKLNTDSTEITVTEALKLCDSQAQIQEKWWPFSDNTSAKWEAKDMLPLEYFDSLNTISGYFESLRQDPDQFPVWIPDLQWLQSLWEIDFHLKHFKQLVCLFVAMGRCQR